MPFFSSNKAILLGGGLLLLTGLAPKGQQKENPSRPPLHFRHQRISLETYESVGAFDVNGDRLPDLVSGAFWYEGPDFIKKHTVGEVRRVGEYYDDFSTLPVDVNGDGRLDFITGGWWGQTLRWLENPVQAPGERPAQTSQVGEWTQHRIAECGNVETTRSWDIDGDGFPEFTPNNPGFPLKFYRLNRSPDGKPLGTFSEHPVFSGKQGHGLGYGDLNGDGRKDFILPDGWLEGPPRPLAGNWVWHPDFKLGTVSVPIIVADVNGDGRADLIAGQAHSYGLDWYEQTPQGWKKHPIDPNHSQFHEMKWVDLDGDQVPELLTGKRYRAHNDSDPGSHDDYGLYYYQWTGEAFVKQVICYGSVGHTKGTGIHLDVTDLNGDGRVDIAVAGKDGLSVFFNEGIRP